MLAIIKTGGKQYIVEPGTKVRIEKLLGEEGEKAVFDEVLLFGDEKGVQIGAPKLSDVAVEGKILKQGRARKVFGIKYKAKKRYSVKFGHRQYFTEVEITKVG